MRPHKLTAPIFAIASFAFMVVFGVLLEVHLYWSAGVAGVATIYFWVASGLASKAESAV